MSHGFLACNEETPYSESKVVKAHARCVLYGQKEKENFEARREACHNVERVAGGVFNLRHGTCPVISAKEHHVSITLMKKRN